MLHRFAQREIIWEGKLINLVIECIKWENKKTYAPSHLSVTPPGSSGSKSKPIKQKCKNKDEFGPKCLCFEDNTAYFGNNERVGSENPQPNRLACQRSCEDHPKCKYWTWGKGEPNGPCYLKTARENIGRNLTSYVSGTKFCKLPESKGRDRAVKIHPTLPTFDIVVWLCIETMSIVSNHGIMNFVG